MVQHFHVDHRPAAQVDLHTRILELALQQRNVKVGNTVFDEGRVADKCRDPMGDFPKRGCLSHHLVRDVVHGGRRLRHRYAGVDVVGEGVHDAVWLNTHEAELHNAIGPDVRAGALEIDRNHGDIERRVRTVWNRRHRLRRLLGWVKQRVKDNLRFHQTVSHSELTLRSGQGDPSRRPRA